MREPSKDYRVTCCIVHLYSLHLHCVLLADQCTEYPPDASTPSAPCICLCTHVEYSLLRECLNGQMETCATLGPMQKNSARTPTFAATCSLRRTDHQCIIVNRTCRGTSQAHLRHCFGLELSAYTSPVQEY